MNKNLWIQNNQVIRENKQRRNLWHQFMEEHNTQRIYQNKEGNQCTKFD